MNFQLSQAMEILSQTPATVRSLIENLSDEFIYVSAEKNGWNSFEIVGHYIHAEETNWIPRAKSILEQGADKNFPPFDRFGHLQKIKGKKLSELLDDFAAIRIKNIEILKSWNLTEEDLNLKGIHPEFGEVTLGQLLATWCVHDLTHLRQISTVIAKQYSEDVGPWKEYLSILK